MSNSVEEALQEFVKGNRRFTASIYKELIKTKSGNIIVSPLSAETILALVNEGARGETSMELVTGLSLPSSDEKIHTAFKMFSKYTRNIPKVEIYQENLKLLSANKIYVNDDVILEDKFKSIATNIYDSEVANVNFSKKLEAAQTINSWVEDKTNKKIKELIDPTAINSETKLVLVNALYFSGKWVTNFCNYHTRKKKFFKTKEDSVDIDMMNRVENFNYYENPTLNAKFLELPYKDADISMVVVLPNEVEGLGSLEQNIEAVLQPQPFEEKRVILDLPKFTITTEIDFVPILQSLGIRKAFDVIESDFSGISSTHKYFPQNLLISGVFQKTFINVTETGTEAAAATVEICITCDVGPYTVSQEIMSTINNDEIKFRDL